MQWFRLWRFRRRYRRNLRKMRAAGKATWAYDMEEAADKFREGLSKVSAEEWQRYGLHERKWR